MSSVLVFRLFLPKKTGFASFAGDCLSVSTKLGATPAEALDDAASIAATMKYMVFHALACHLSFVSSALCMTYIYVHLFFALAGLVFSLYLGSAWYDRMLTSHVTKKVRKHIAASTAKKD